MDWDYQDSSAQQAMGWPQGTGKERPGCTRLLGRRSLWVTDNLPPGTGICRCLAAPAGLSRRLPTHSGPASGSSEQLRPAQSGLWPGSWGCPWKLPHGTALPLSGLCFTCPLALLRSKEMGRREPGSVPRLMHPPPHPAPSQGLRARAAAPCLGCFPHGASCHPGTSPPALHFTPGLVK